jgi:C4-dicarboxylate-specific signal transduction histidine kinase
MKVLIAEDDLASRLVLKVNLQKWGHEVVEAQDGDQAWQLLQTEKPKIAILDWMMPGVEGMELCRRIRANTEGDYIYVILLTAKGGNEDVVVGLDAGADDYITKPFDREIMRSRIAVGERIVRYETLLAEKNAQLQRYSCEMEKIAEERSKQLVHAERMATVGVLSAGIAHEINNPTAFISGNIQTLGRFCSDLEPSLRKQMEENSENRGKLEFILEEMPKTVEGIQKGVARISRIVNGLKSFCRKNKDSEKTAACDLNTCIGQALELCHNALKYNVTVNKDIAEDLPQIKADSQQIEQVLINLFVNAADAMKEKEQGIISIAAQCVDDSVTVKVSDNGQGIPDDKLNDIWQPFFTTKPPDKGTGLGLFTVQSIIENHEGQIKVENKSSGGAEFSFTLPALT